MKDVNIKASITVDTGNAVPEIKGVDQALKGAGATAGEGKQHFSNLKDSLTNMSPGLKSAQEGVNSLSGAFKALLLNPVVLVIAAIVAALAGLYAAFTSTMAGAEKMDQVFQGIKATLTVITDRLVTFGNAIIKVFTGDFKGAMDGAKASVNGLSDAIGNAYTKTVEITKQLQAIKKEELQDAQDQAKRKARLAELKEMVNDEAISISERKKLAKDLKADQDADAKLDLARTKKRVDLEIQQIRLKTNLTFEDLKKESDLKIELDNAARDASMEGVRINKIVRNLDKQESAAGKERAAERKKAEEERMAKLKADTSFRVKLMEYENQQFDLSDKEAKKMIEASDKENAKKKEDANAEKIKQADLDQKARISDLTIQKKVNDEKIESDKKTAAAQIQVKEMFRDAVINILNSLSAIAGRETAAGKALAVAGAAIDTYAAIAKTLKAFAGVPIPGYAIVQSIATGIAGLAAIKNILKVDVPGQGSGGSSANLAAPIQPMAISTSTNLSDSTINAVGAAAGGVGRSFILDSEITNNAERAARLNRAARLG